MGKLRGATGGAGPMVVAVWSAHCETMSDCARTERGGATNNQRLSTVSPPRALVLRIIRGCGFLTAPIS